MKNLLFILIAVITLSSCQEQQKIAFINNSLVINDYEEKKDIEAKYKTKIDAYNVKRDSIGQALQLEYQKFQLESKKLSQAKAQTQYDALMQKQQLLQQQFQFEEQQIAKQSQTEIDSLIIKVKGFVSDYGKKNAYTYILGTSDGAATVLYGTDENDLSKTILDLLNAKYKEEK